MMPAQDDSRPIAAPPSTGLQPVRRSNGQFPENTPEWEYEIESRHVAAEEQKVAALERLATATETLASTTERLAVAMAGLQEQMERQAAALEALVEGVRAMNQK